MPLDEIALSTLAGGLAIPLPSNHRLTLKRLDTSSMRAILELRGEVIDSLPDPDFLRPEADEDQYVRAFLGPDGISIGVFANTRLIAYTAMCLPCKQCTLTALGLSDCLSRHAPLHTTAYMLVSMISPHSRIKGIHLDMIEVKYKMAENLGRTDRFGICSLANYPSLRNLLKYYFIVDIIKLFDPVFGPLTRFLVHMSRYRPEPTGETFWLKSTNECAQKELLSMDFVGVDCRFDRAGNVEVAYRPVCSRQAPHSR